MSKVSRRGEETSLFDQDGQRKYLSRSEGRRFLRAATTMDKVTRIFCRLLHFTGCRLSEGLELTTLRLDLDGRRVIFRTLKRRKPIFRSVPIPALLMTELQSLARQQVAGNRLFPWSRQTGWRRVKKVMIAAAINGPQAKPLGLRHHFGIRALQANVPLTTTQRLMGHASPNTTAIYLQVVGEDERRFLHRMWRDDQEQAD